MDISVRNEGTWQAEDRSWLGSAHGTDATRSITLDVSKFTSGTHYPNGYIPSGVLLGKVTSGGLYGPYDDAANDGRQTAVGVLFSAVKPGSTTSVRVAGALQEHGAVVEAKLPTNSGVDAAAKTDLAGRIIFR